MINDYFSPTKKSAVKAKSDALKIAFSPIVFQVSYTLLKLNILETVGNYPTDGLTAKQISQTLQLSEYGVKLLLDVALSFDLVWLNEDHYILDKTGYFLLADQMIKVNMDFIQDVCYEGLSHLLESIKTGKPEGLKVFGNWKTIYPAISNLPEPAKSSWFKFDHYYSDKVFPHILPIVFKQPPKQIYDIGGNTGKWAKACLSYNHQVQVTIFDLPEQINVIEKNYQNDIHKDRLHTYAIDLLNPESIIPTPPDVIWMSQFLDCFSEAEILSILTRAANIMQANTRLYILELFWDRQEYESAAFTINCTSIYFTCLANGNSRMYHSKDLLKLVLNAGLYIEEDIDHLGPGHTLLCCRKKPSI